MADGNYVALNCKACSGAFSWFRPAGQRGRNAGFCSEACRSAESDREKRTVPCPTCAKPFRPRRVSQAQSAQQFCSIACRRYPAAKVYETTKERDFAASYRRRARKRGGGYERFGREEVFERDGWTCKLCGEPVDRTGKDKHLRPALDHIVPLARGGQHSRSNTQCTHWVCNSRKAHRLVSALPAPSAWGI